MDSNSVQQAEQWKQQARDAFDFSAAYYAASREAEKGFQFQRDIVLSMLKGRSGTVLDIGCAAGSIIAPLRERSFRVTGMEYAPGMISFAQHRFAGDSGVVFSLGDMEKLPFATHSFDNVICLGVLEYLPNYDKSLSEIYRVLHPGGLAIFSIPNRRSPFYVLEGIAEKHVRPWARKLVGRTAAKSDSVPAHQRNFCVPSRFQQSLRSHDFEPTQSAFSNYFVFLVERFWPRLHERMVVALEGLSGFPPLAWTGCQFLIAARKSEGVGRQ